MERVIEPEWLDELPSDDPRAQRSRADLRRINWLMNNAGLITSEMRKVPKLARVLDLGAGDGAFALRLAKKLARPNTEFLLVDRIGGLSSLMREGFKALNCAVQFHLCDALGGLSEIGQVDVAFVNLFLHHFHEAELKQLLATVAARCRVFIACEPRRSAFALFASRGVGLIGCNDVTRHDAVASVRAGFHNDELSRLWPDAARWALTEKPAGLFSHLFVARRL